MASPTELEAIQTARESMEARGFLPPQRLARTIYVIMKEHGGGAKRPQVELQEGVTLKRTVGFDSHRTATVRWGEGQGVRIEHVASDNKIESNIYEMQANEEGIAQMVSIPSIDIETGERVLSVLENAISAKVS